MSFCDKCGAQLVEGATFCHKCGTPVSPTFITVTPSTNTTMSIRKTHRGRNIAIICSLILIMSISYYYISIQQLEASLVDVGLVGVGLTSATANVVIEVRNPSLFPIYISSGSFTMYINNQRLSYGSIGSLTVGGNSLQRVTIQVSFSYYDVGMSLVNLITSGGVVMVTLSGSLSSLIISVPFSTHANLDFN